MRVVNRNIYSYIYLVILLTLSHTSCISNFAVNKQNTNEPAESSDSERFSLEYPLVGNENIFVYKNSSETVSILANGTGIMFMGFKECPWCQLYVTFLHDVAREMGVKIIFYCDIREERQNNTENYQKIVGILSGMLQFDNEGHPRVYVPDLTIIDNGKIICRDFETSKDTLGYNNPQEYWTEERIDALKNKLREAMGELLKVCYICD